MSLQRVAVIFDDTVRPDTTGVYCRRALGRFVDVEHVRPTELDRLSGEHFDLYLTIDDGLNYPLPASLHPSAYWAIDTHLDFERELQRAQSVDVVFAAQLDGAHELRQRGIATATWLPLACDPDLHGKQPVAGKNFDVCFVGNVFPGPREELLRLIQKQFPRSFAGRRFFTEMAQTYSESRCVFNRSLRNDVNMRVFEALASGSLLVTNELRENGQDQLFRDGIHLATYRDADELIDKIGFYLKRDELRERVAETGRQAAVAQHTYGHRMQSLLEAVEKHIGNRTQVSMAPVDRMPEPGPAGPAVDFETWRQPPGRQGLTSVVIVTYGQIEYTRLCLDSLRKQTPCPCEVIVVDNGSTDGTAEYVRQQPDVTLIANAENRGFPAAANQGIFAAAGENVLLLNNDTIVAPGWLETMLAALERDSRIGLVGPCSNNVSGGQQIPASYDSLDGIGPFAREWGRKHAGQSIDTDRLVGFCLLVRREVFQRIGLLDERFGIGNYEDDDLCRRALQAGYRVTIAVDSFVHHFGHRTFAASGIDFGKLLDENRRKFEQKWNLVPPAAVAKAQATPASVTGGPVAARPRFGVTRSSNGGLLLVPAAVRLSLCMIVRDNEHTIGPALESIRPWVDEIVVVDTGSADRTPDICRQSGARLFEFPWCDDFSAARNVSLQHARGEWLFWMDSDDTISADCGRQLRALADGSHADEILGYVMQVHCPKQGTNGECDVTVVDHVKLVRNRPDLRFEGRIHEQLLPAIRRAGGDVAWTGIFVTHSGSDQTPEGWQRKLDRDLRILHQELEENSEHPFVLFNLGMTYADAKRHDEAVSYLERCLAVSRPEESHLRKAYAILVSSLHQAARHDQAWTFCEQGVALFPGDKELLFRSAMLHHHFGRLEEAEQTYRRVLEEPEQRHFSSVDSELAGAKARHNLAIVYEDMGRLDRAEEQWRQIVRQAPANVDAWRGLSEVLLSAGKLADADQVAHELLPREDPLGAVGLLLRGKLAATRGDLSSALPDFEAASQQDPQNLEALRLVCRALFEQGALERAETALRELTDRAPGDAAAFHNLGTVQYQRRSYDQAAAAFQRSVELRPDAPDTRFHWGWSLKQAGRAEAAVTAWRELLERFPDHSAARESLAAAEARADRSIPV